MQTQNQDDQMACNGVQIGVKERKTQRESMR